MKQKSLYSAMTLLLLSTASSSVMAQLEEIVVTAQKREQRANDIGMAISVLSGDEMLAMGVLDTTDLAAAIPGLTFADSGLSTPIYTLRGVGFNEESVQATASVGVYHDQIAVPFPIMTKGLLMDLERVEVLKGPQGTLFGRNSTGGAINYIANKPGETFEASTTLGYSRYQTVDATGVVSGPLTDNVRARLAVKTVQSGEGWQESVSRNDKLGERNKSAGRLLVDVDFTDTINAQLAASWWQDKSDTQAPQFLEPAYQGLFGSSNDIVNALLDAGDNARIPSLNNSNSDADWWGGNNRWGKPQIDMKSHTFSANINWDINSQMALTSLTSYSKFSNVGSYNVDGFGGIALDKSVGGISAQDTIAAIVRDQYDNYDTIGSSSFSKDTDVEYWSQEIRLSGNSDSLSWIIGGYYSQDEVNSITTQATDFSTNTNIAHFPFGGIGTQGGNNISVQKGDTWAAFGHTEWSFTDNWKLTFGLRYTEDEKDFSGCTADSGDGDSSQYINTLAGANTVPGGCITLLTGTFTGGIVHKNLSEDSLSGKVALDWNITDDVLTYVSYSRGYKSGSFATLSTTTEAQLNPVVQEELDAYELGIKANLFKSQAQLNAAVFYYDYTDKQLLSRVPTIFGALGALTNVPEATVSGAEFDLVWAPIDGLYLNIGASYVSTEVKEFTGYNQFGIQGDMSGSEFPITPEYQASGGVNYEWTMGNNLTAFVGVDASYTDSFTTDYKIKSVINNGSSGSYNALLAGFSLEAGDSFDVHEVLKLDSSLVIGARAGIRSADETWTATLWGRNITDEFRPINARKQLDGILRYTGMPATFGVTLTYNW